MGRHQNLSVALLSQTQELLFLLLYLLELLELIPLHNDIPSSSSSAIGKSGQSNQSIKQASRQDFDSMTTTDQRAAVVKMGNFGICDP